MTKLKWPANGKTEYFIGGAWYCKPEGGDVISVDDTAAQNHRFYEHGFVRMTETDTAKPAERKPEPPKPQPTLGATNNVN